MSIIDVDKKYVAGTYARFPVEIIDGKGSILNSPDGKEYIDMGSGIGVTAFGIADDIWVKAVSEQLGKLQHVSNLYYTEPCALLAKALCEKTGMKKVFFGNSGAEANECAIKVARKYGADTKGVDYNVIVTLKYSFHGRTLTTLAATGQDVFHSKFLPLTDGFVYATANDIESVEKLLANIKSNQGNFKYKSKVYYYSKDSQNNIKKIAITGNSYINKMKRNILKIILIEVGITFIIISLVVITWSNNLVNRIKKLKDKVDNINNDNYNHNMIYNYDDELYTLEEALENMRLYLKRQDEYKNQMYQNISHDFKTPITVMKSYIEASEDGIESNEKTIEVLKEQLNKLEIKVHS